MQKLTMIVVFIVLGTSIIFSQHSKSCCSTGEKKETKVSFTSFGSDHGFRDSHQLPKDFILSDAKGKMIKIRTDEGEDANAYYIQSESHSDKFIFVIHEWWGLNDNIKREADELKAALGDVNILALDLYDGKIATIREDAAQLMQSADFERIRNIFNGAVKFAGSDSKIGTIGWCFGGGWSLQMSLWLGEQAKACVIYYGIIENDEQTFKDLHAPVLGIFAKQDDWVTPAVYRNLEKNIQAAGKKIILKDYDAEHAFANPSNQDFNEAFSTDAKSRVIKFFKENLMN